jgi:hypothetical protein
MHLNESEVARFYSIWFPLLHFVNQHRKVVPTFPREWRNAGVSPEVAVPVRDVLWENDSLRETFITESPAGLSQADLALVESWKHQIENSFSSSAILRAARCSSTFTIKIWCEVIKGGELM